MANIQFFLSIFSKWPMSHRSTVYLKRILLLILGLVLSVLVFIHLNEVPTKKVDVSVDGYGVTKADVDLLLSLGRNTGLRERFDSSYRNAFANSGRDGLNVEIYAEGGSGDYLLFEEVSRAKDVLDEAFSNKIHLLDSLNSAICLRLVTEDIHQRLRMFNTTHKYRNDTLSRQDTCRSHPSRFFIIRGAETVKIRPGGLKQSEKHFLFFEDTLSMATESSHSSTNSTLINNRSIWQASDISQAYVGIHLSESLHQKHSSGGGGNQSYYFDNLHLMNTTLSIDFGSPVSFSSMVPEPDSVNMTGMSFIAPEKICQIVRDGLVFHVTFEQNKNLQAVKIFWVTTIIAALLGLFFDQCFKWGKYLKQKRKMEKRKMERMKQNLN